MAKLTATDLRNDGWRDAQFGGGFANTAAFDAFLQGVADEGGRWAEAKVGATPYADATAPGYVHDCLRRAELHRSQAVLWRRRAAHFDAQGQTGLQHPAAAERRAYLAHADAAMLLATEALADAMIALGLDPAGATDVSGFASGHIETGRYPISSSGALNG